MGAATGIVMGESREGIRRQADIEMRRGAGALDDVDESPGFLHAEDRRQSRCRPLKMKKREKVRDEHCRPGSFCEGGGQDSVRIRQRA